MNKIIIPNFVTSLNILSGSVSIYISLRHPEHLFVASFLVFFASILDFLDGFLARLLKAQSEFGKQMDSLSDLVSFGLAPAFIMFNLIEKTTENIYLPFIAFLIIILSAIRLAIFNITDQKTEFVGMPTPALAIFVASIPVISKFSVNSKFLFDINMSFLFSNAISLTIITVLLSIMLIAKIPMLSLKFTNYRFSDNKPKYILIICSVILFLLLLWYAIPMMIILYVIISLIMFASSNKKIKK